MQNVLLVLGIPALIAPIRSQDDTIRSTVFFLIGVTMVFMLELFTSPLSRFDGLMLLLFLAVFLFQQFANARKASEPSDDYHDEIGEVPSQPKVILALLIAGLIALPIGATLTVDSAVEIARRWMVSEDIIGLTIVAIGTSLPELATGIMAAKHNNASVGLGNVVGSNLFNIAAIMGVTATVAGSVPVGAHIIGFDMWVMLAATLFLFALCFTKLSITRTGGALMTGAYLVYLIATALI